MSSTPKIVTCQDLEFEFFMNFELQRCSTPNSEALDKTMQEEKKRVRQHFQRLLALIQISALSPADLRQTQEALNCDAGLPCFSPTRVMLNRLTAEITRKHTLASLFEGPISNSPQHRSRYQ